MTDKTSHTQRMAEFIYSLNYQDLPQPVIDQAKNCVFHLLACSLAGHHLPWSQVGVRTLRAMGLDGRATTFVDGLKAPALEAALVNASVAQSTGQEDMHTDSVSHPGTIVIPAALALGEELEGNGRDFLTAVVAGYEIMARVGASVANPEFARKFRPSGVFGPFGSAAAAAKLLGLSKEQTANALGMAGNLAVGLNQWAMEGTDELVYQNGFASSNGIRAARMAGHGLRAARFILEGPSGFWTAYGRNASASSITEGLGRTFEIMKVYFKVAGACYTTQTAVDLTLKMARSQEINPEEIESIDIRTFTAAKEYPGGDHKGPFNDLLMPKMSLPYGVSAVLVFKEISQSIYDRYQDPLVSRLARKCNVSVDPEIDRRYPEKQGGLISITMRDGKIIQESQEDRRSMTGREVVENFKTEAGRVLSDERAESLATVISGLENLERLNDLTALFVKK